MTLKDVAATDSASAGGPRAAFQGEAARRWFSHRGWRAVPPPGAPILRVFAHEMDTPFFTVRRIWHTAATMTPIPPGAGEGEPTVLLQVDGELIVGDSGKSIALPAGGSALVPPGIIPTYVSHQATARIEIRSRPRMATRPWTDGIISASTPTTSWRLLANTVTTLLNDVADPEESSFAAVQSALEFLASAVALEIAPGGNVSSRETTASSLETLRARSERLIRQRAASPSFSVGALAEQLEVSPSYLARAYRGTGATPSERIRAVRLDLATDVPLELGGTARASLAGFSSRRAFIRATQALRTNSPAP